MECDDGSSIEVMKLRRKQSLRSIILAAKCEVARWPKWMRDAAHFGTPLVTKKPSKE